LAADRVVGQIHDARTLGAAGFVIFNFDHGTAESIVPSLGLGVGSQPAIPSHTVKRLSNNWASSCKVLQIAMKSRKNETSPIIHVGVLRSFHAQSRDSSLLTNRR